MEENKDKKNKKIVALTLIIILVILIIILSIFAIAKYVTKKDGTTTAEIAEMICEMDVEASEASKEIINPYCLVNVKNYDSDNKVTQTDLNYTITITPKGDFELPEYYWKDVSSDTIVARSTAITGSFEYTVKADKQYKVVFLNPGVEDITIVVDFNLIAVQVEPK